MSGKPVNLRERARRDIEEAVDHYLNATGAGTALRFADALERAFAHIELPVRRERHPVGLQVQLACRR